MNNISNNCNTPYEVIPIDNGKSKFCKICGTLLYKNVNNTLNFNLANVLPIIQQVEEKVFVEETKSVTEKNAASEHQADILKNEQIDVKNPLTIEEGNQLILQ